MDKYVLERLRRCLPAAPGINGKDEYVNCAVIVLLLWADGEYHFVFEKRAANIRQAGEICFPGGKFDPVKDTDFQETALRETTEELGVQPEKIRIVGRLETVLAPMGTSVDAFLGIIDVQSVDALNVNHGEVERVFTVPVSFFEQNEPDAYKINVTAHPFYVDETGNKVVSFPAEELGLPERYKSSWPIAPYNIYAYQVAGETIWGMTARLVKSVIAKIKLYEEIEDKTSESKAGEAV